VKKLGNFRVCSSFEPAKFKNLFGLFRQMIYRLFQMIQLRSEYAEEHLDVTVLRCEFLRVFQRFLRRGWGQATQVPERQIRPSGGFAACAESISPDVVLAAAIDAIKGSRA